MGRALVIAALGLYAQDVPLLGDVIRSRQPTPGEPALASVHRGLHEGLFGAKLAATALILSCAAAVGRASLYLSLMFVYGVMVSPKTAGTSRWSSADGRTPRCPTC